MKASEKDSLINFVFLIYEKISEAKTDAVMRDLVTALELLELKEQSRIIELPVPIGTEVYYICKDYRHDFCGEWKVKTFKFDACDLEDWGKIIFATKEEAENRLAELRGKEK